MPFSPPRSPVLRTRRLTLRLSDAERSRIEHHAAAIGLPVSTYLRQIALGEPLRARRRHIDQAAAAQIARIGNNLRQLQRVATDEAGDLEAARDLDATAETLYATMRQLFDSLHVRAPS